MPLLSFEQMAELRQSKDVQTWFKGTPYLTGHDPIFKAGDKVTHYYEGSGCIIQRYLGVSTSTGEACYLMDTPEYTGWIAHESKMTLTKTRWDDVFNWIKQQEKNWHQQWSVDKS
jgi:hypothetical protein